MCMLNQLQIHVRTRPAGVSVIITGHAPTHKLFIECYFRHFLTSISRQGLVHSNVQHLVIS